MKTSSKQSTHRETSTELRLSQWFSFRPLELTYFLMRDLLARDICNWKKKKKEGNVNFSWVSEEMLLKRGMQWDYKTYSPPRAIGLHKLEG